MWCRVRWKYPLRWWFTWILYLPTIYMLESLRIILGRESLCNRSLCHWDWEWKWFEISSVCFHLWQTKNNPLWAEIQSFPITVGLQAFLQKWEMPSTCLVAGSTSWVNFGKLKISYLTNCLHFIIWKLPVTQHLQTMNKLTNWHAVCTWNMVIGVELSQSFKQFGMLEPIFVLITVLLWAWLFKTLLTAVWRTKWV